MAARLDVPDDVTVRRADWGSRGGRRSTAIGSVLGTTLRCLLLGIGIGVIASAGPASVDGVVAAGVLAIGAALVSWSE